MFTSGSDVQTVAMTLLLNCAAIVCAMLIAFFALRRVRLSRSTRRRALYAALGGAAALVAVANLFALAAPVGFVRFVCAYGAIAVVILWAMVKLIPSSQGEHSTG